MEPKRPSLATRGCPQAGCGHAAAQEHCREDLRRGEWIPAFRRRVDLRVAGWPPGGESAVPGRVGEAEPFSF